MEVAGTAGTHLSTDLSKCETHCPKISALSLIALTFFDQVICRFLFGAKPFLSKNAHPWAGSGTYPAN